MTTKLRGLLSLGAELDTIGALVLGGLISAFAVPALAQSLGPLVRITPLLSPLAGCTADNPKKQEKEFGSILYKNSNPEPWVTVDPTDTRRLIVSHQTDRWSDGGSRGGTGQVSTNGGATWSLTIPSGVTACTGDTAFLRSSDFWVDIAPTRTALFMSLVTNPGGKSTPFGTTSGGMVVSRSTSHGATWESPKALIIDDTPNVLNDKNSLTADPTKRGYAYAVWDRLEVFPFDNQPVANLGGAESPIIGDGVALAWHRVKQLRAQAAGAAPAQQAPSFKGPTFFTKTVDDGVSWTRAVPIYDPGVNAQTINNLITVPPDGNVLDFFTNIASSGALSIGYVLSTDKGFSFSGPTFATDIQVVDVFTPDRHELVRAGAALYAVAVNHTNGALYLAWMDCRFGPACDLVHDTGVDSIAFSQSLDGGGTWSKPVKINKTPANATRAREQAFTPTIVIAGDGTVIVTYYDFRNDTNTPGLEAVDDWVLFCKAASVDCTNPANWTDELRLTPSSFNMLNAPFANGLFVGDYMGLAAAGLDAWAVFGAAELPNRTADFVRHIVLPHAVASNQ